jgi:predicted Zn-dependent protease
VVHAKKRKGFISINRYDDDAVHKAVQEAIFMAKSSEPDEANDISTKHALECFKHGQKEVDSSIMYDRINEFLDYCGSTYPNTKLEQCVLDFNYDESFFTNTNDAEFIEHSGLYSFFFFFIKKI